MQNRRRNYRHLFASGCQLTVSLQPIGGSPPITAEVIDLSVEGMCVRARIPEDLAAARWLATFALGLQVLQVPALIVHAQSIPPLIFGFQFLAPVDAHSRDVREKTIWKFLLDEQRRQRPPRKDSESAPA